MKNINQKGGQNSGQTFRKKPFHNDNMKKNFSSKANQQKNVKLQKFKETSSGDFLIGSKINPPSTSSSSGDFLIRSKNITPSTSSSSSSQKLQKKPFDKKLWRLQKYSKKYKLDQYEENRKKYVLKEYYRQISDDKPKFDVQKIYEEEQSDNEVNDNENNLNSDINQSNCAKQKVETVTLPSKSGNKRKWAFKKAQDEFERIKEERHQKKKENLQKQAERDEALKEYKKKKTDKFKKLSKRTKKGQPIMKDRMEMLLEEIQNSLNN